MSFVPASGEVSLMDWHERMYPIPLAEGTSCRVRYCARGMDAGKTADTGAPEIADHYLLIFWPAPAKGDRILRQTSRIAARWHTEGFTRQPG